MDDQGVVDVDEEGQLLLPTQRQQLHPLQLDGQLAVALEGRVHRHAFIVHRLEVGQGHRHTVNHAQLICVYRQSGCRMCMFCL